MRYAPAGHDRNYTHAVAAELARVLTGGGRHELEELFEAAAEACCIANNPEPCRELVRLHVVGRLKNWYEHGFVELCNGSYRAVGEELSDLTNHAVAEHCRDLLETVHATGKACDDFPEDREEHWPGVRR
jgi:hypothetical protein